MKMVKYLIPLFVFSALLLSKEKQYKVQQDVTIQANDQRPIVIEGSDYTLPQTREEIDLFVEDFENDAEGWNLGNGWQLSTDEANSPTHSVLSPNNDETLNGTFDLLSPTISLPGLGDGETMSFSFFIKGDTPDTDGDADNYLEDYYTVSLMDIDALAWHGSSTDSYDGNSYWCGDEEIGGYLDSWIQFLDTPSFTVPSGATLTADMMWTIEAPTGASVAGSCTDGWDAANVQISVDGGSTWDLLTGSDPYDFDCGYGWIWNSTEYDTGGSLNHLAAGWGGNADWHNVSFSLSQYAGQDAIIRFAFGSDPAYCTLDDSSITGFHVDNITVSGALSCDPETDCDYSASGAVWVDQFYDYCADGQTGSNGIWEEYVAGMPFNGNVFLDISDFAEKDVTFRIQSRYDENHDGGQGAGLFIDDFRIFKISGGSYPPPYDLAGEALNESVELTWADMNASGTDDFQFDNDSFSNEISMSNEGSTAYAGIEIPLAGGSTVNQVSIFSSETNGASVSTKIGAFGQFGSLYANEPDYEMDVVLVPGWNDFAVNWSFNNGYIIGYEFTDTIVAALDESASPSDASHVLFAGSAWEDVTTALSALAVDGEWGVRANISYDGADVTYNVYVDGVQSSTGVTDNSATVTGLTNNQTYNFAVSAVYSDGEESGLSDSIDLTPQAQTVHEESHDDGSAEGTFNAGSGNFTAVKYSAVAAGEQIVRFKWFQEGPGGAFYVKVFENNGNEPGEEIYSQVVAGGLVDGWNTKDLLSNNWTASGDFWIGTKEFSSTSPFGLDDSGSGNSMTRTATGAWTAIDGNLMVRVYLDCGEDCGDTPPPCTAGDINADGIINVLDVVQAVNFVLGQSSPNADQACASDYNSDGIINVLDIVSIVNLVLGG